VQREDHIVHFRDLLTFSLASNDVTMNRSDRDALMGALSALNWVLRPAQPGKVPLDMADAGRLFLRWPAAS